MMSKPIIFRSNRDLLTWVDDRIPTECPDFQMKSICWHIMQRKDRPNWFADWSQFLSTLPVNLLDLLEEVDR